MGSELLVQGLVMLVLGMGTVFVFLGLLVLVTGGMSAFVLRYLPSAPSVPSATVANPAQSAASGTDPVLLAAIAAAIHRHRGGRSD